MSTPDYVWMNGEIVPWDDATIHVNTDAVLRGSNVFEGIRAYRAAEGDDLLLMQVDEHLDRLFDVSLRILRMPLPWTRAELKQAIKDTLAANGIREDTHIRVVCYFGQGKEAHFLPEDIEIGAFILTLPRPQSAALASGVRTMISPWRRISDNVMPPRAKSGANYMNSRLSSADARIKGFDLPILLNDRGKVSEGPGQCIFVVRDGVVRTPRRTDGILEGITRDTVLRLAAQMGHATEECEIDATELYVAQEAFFAGTAAEILPIREVDGYELPAPGPVTAALQAAYTAIVRGTDPAERALVESVYA
jgi:branched-chain amino acid aminotransferase